MSKFKKYDLIFSIGEACSCTEMLRKCRLQFYSYPFDWLFGSTFLNRIKMLCDDMKTFINKEETVIGKTTFGYDDIKNYKIMAKLETNTTKEKEKFI